jgi:hypothetical protein
LKDNSINVSLSSSFQGYPVVPLGLEL